jgi:imidazolonepropionase
LTVNAARALGLPDRGQLVAGQRADFCVWDAGHPRELAYYFGRNSRRATVLQGRQHEA